ncbi:MAG: O-antigen ligase family protein [Pseudolabrys sp.]|nr:O-antigen ligase family protein [Pseudolabrys sp.]MDP2295583.1 O-antigen ligase family protein [Pseudolabrys sp.]
MKLMPHVRNRLESLADVFAVLLAASLPWSTSATGILTVLWLLAFIPVCDLTRLRRIALSPAGGLPLMLVALGALGMLWADVAWAERANGISSFLKLLFIPLLMCHFVTSQRAHHVLIGFLASCTLLLLVSWVIFIWPAMPFPVQAKGFGVPVKDYISQGAMFTICVAITLHIAFGMWRDGRRNLAMALGVLAVLFLANVFYVATSRTSLVVIPALLVLFGYRQFGWKGIIASAAVFLLLAAAAWPSAGYLRQRVGTFVQEVQSYQPDGPPTPAGERLVFWTKSAGFIQAAPIFGHGTGSIRDQFERSAAGRTGMAAAVSTNPHNQILAVGIQLGFVGIAVLLAMWISHALLFRAAGLASWVGLVVATQNILGSQFNTHLFDFTHGWLYVVGIGIAGGVALKNRQA